MLPFSFRPMSRILIFVSSSQITDLIGFNTFTVEAGARFNFVHLTSHFAQCLELVIFSIVYTHIPSRGVKYVFDPPPTLTEDFCILVKGLFEKKIGTIFLKVLSKIFWRNLTSKSKNCLREKCQNGEILGKTAKNRDTVISWSSAHFLVLT